MPWRTEGSWEFWLSSFMPQWHEESQLSVGLRSECSPGSPFPFFLCLVGWERIAPSSSRSTWSWWGQRCRMHLCTWQYDCHLLEVVDFSSRRVTEILKPALFIGYILHYQRLLRRVSQVCCWSKQTNFHQLCKSQTCLVLICFHSCELSPGFQNRAGNTDIAHHGSSPHFSKPWGEELGRTKVSDITPRGWLKLEWKTC